MMGASHAITGASAWVFLTSSATLPLTGLDRFAWYDTAKGWPEHIPLGLALLDVSPTAVAAGAIVTAGAALLPDADHHNATIAHSLPPVSEKVCRGLSKMFGGHRKGTHSLLGVAFFMAVAWMMNQLSGALAGLLVSMGQPEAAKVVAPLQIGPGIVAMLLVCFAMRALNFLPDYAKKASWGIGIAAGLFVTVSAPETNWWFPIAVGLGAVLHILGDQITNDGVNWLWPIVIKPPKAWSRSKLLTKVWQKDGDQAFPILGKVGSAREWAIASIATVHALAGIVMALSAVGEAMVATG